ncbi:MAG: radical SAM protein [bacterium]|nr:radical SAM protein [bacterium]
MIGSLSPGCRTCIAGTWCCIFINGACTRDCFFCPSPQRHSDKNRQPCVPENLSFASIHDYIEYLEKFDYEGISFSGGEPLLTIDRVLEYMQEIKRCFGDKHYIWAYTNGDLVTGQTLSRLKQAGLNELRFDIAANNYDLTAVEKAVEYIDTVSVEIPAIPEDTENLKPMLKEMEKIGVKHLNLHQLMKTDHNAEHLNQRGYSPVNEKIYPGQTPIIESELAALDLLKHAIEMKSDVGINYCSRCFKARFQSMGHRKRAALFCTDQKPDLTETGYLRKVAIDASTEEAAMIKSHVHETEWEMTVEGKKSELVFPLEYFDLLLTENYHKADVMYYEPLLVPANNETTVEASTEIFAGNTIFFQKNVTFRKALDNITSAFLFYKLFIEKIHIETVIKELLHLYGLHEENGGDIIHDTNECYERFQEAEYLSHNLEPYD